MTLLDGKGLCLRCFLHAYMREQYQITLIVAFARPGWQPDPEAERHKLAVLQQTFLKGTGPAVDRDPGPLQERAAALLLMANGDWRGPLTHWCSLACPCKGNPHMVKTLLWLAITDVLFSRIPTVPALSRWTKCSAASRFYVSGTLGTFRAHSGSFD